MTCIDAAIIKALVEHIGGNPDDVVGGTTTDVNSPGGIGIGTRFEAGITLDETGLKFAAICKIGTILRLRHKQTGNITEWICIRSDNRSVNLGEDPMPYYFLSTQTGQIIKMVRVNEDRADEVSISGITSTNYEYDPNDESTGLFYGMEVGRYDQVLPLLTLTTLVKYLFRRLDHEVSDANAEEEYNAATKYYY